MEKNSFKIAQACLDTKPKVLVLNKKAEEAIQIENDIIRIHGEISQIFRVVMKNFYPKREMLNVWTCRPDWVSTQREKTEILYGKGDEFEEKHKLWGLDNICIHPEGFSLLGYGNINSSILTYFKFDVVRDLLLKVKNNERIYKIIKGKVRPEKLEILDLILKQIEDTIFPETFKYAIQNKLRIVGLVGNDSEINEFKGLTLNRGSNINFNLFTEEEEKEGEDKINRKYYGSGSINLPIKLTSFQEILILEQVYEEVDIAIDDYIKKAKNFLSLNQEYLNNMKKDFTKQLILLNLNSKPTN